MAPTAHEEAGVCVLWLPAVLAAVAAHDEHLRASAPFLRWFLESSDGGLSLPV